MNEIAGGAKPLPVPGLWDGGGSRSGEGVKMINAETEKDNRHGGRSHAKRDGRRRQSEIGDVGGVEVKKREKARRREN